MRDSPKPLLRRTGQERHDVPERPRCASPARRGVHEPGAPISRFEGRVSGDSSEA